MLVIGVTGKKGHGKDTFADYLVDKHNFIKISFAEPLKKACQILFNLTDEQLYGNKKEVNDSFWNTTPRMLFQYIGTDLLRNQLKNIMPQIKNNIWVEIARKKILDLEKENKHLKIVISDVRFENEIEFIEELKGVCVRVVREKGIFNNNDQHSSEIALDKIEMKNIDNNKTLEDLFKQADNLINELNNTAV